MFTFLRKLALKWKRDIDPSELIVVVYFRKHKQGKNIYCTNKPYVQLFHIK